MAAFMFTIHSFIQQKEHEGEENAEILNVWVGIHTTFCILFESATFFFL